MADILITAAPIDIDGLEARLRTTWRGSGAIVSFLGQVRADDGVTTLLLEHYPGLTEQEIARASQMAEARWLLDGLCIAHRVGALSPGDAIVFVAAAAAHRRDAFECVDFMMDYLKSQAPFWKKQYANGAEEWIEPRAADHADARRWIRKEA